MKGTWMILIGFALFSGLAAHGKERCSNATLNGSFGVYASGTIIGVGPVALVGVFTFDGKGSLNGAIIQKVNGNIVEVTFTGTYAVDPSCTFTDTTMVSNGQTVTHAAVIVDGGRKFYILNTTPPTGMSGNVIVGVGKKQLTEDESE